MIPISVSYPLSSIHKPILVKREKRAPEVLSSEKRRRQQCQDPKERIPKKKTKKYPKRRHRKKSYTTPLLSTSPTTRTKSAAAARWVKVVYRKVILPARKRREAPKSTVWPAHNSTCRDSRHILPPSAVVGVVCRRRGHRCRICCRSCCRLVPLIHHRQ